MRLAVVVVLALSVVLVACSGAAGTPTAASSVAGATPGSSVAAPEASVATASPAPSASTTPANCLAKRAYDLLSKPSLDWTTVSQDDREMVAAALEAYDFSDGLSFNPDYVARLVAQLRKPGAALLDLAPMALWAGQVTIVACS